MQSIPTVTVQDGALGAIIEEPATRKRVYSVWVVIGLVLIATTAAVIAGGATALLASQQGWPLWLVVLVAIYAGLAGAYGALSPQMAMLARANTPTIGG